VVRGSDRTSNNVLLKGGYMKKILGLISLFLLVSFTALPFGGESNIFNASPNSTPDDTITVSTLLIAKLKLEG